MAFDRPTRNRLQSFVSDARKLLCGTYDRPGGEITRLLQRYGIQPDGHVVELEKIPNLKQRQYEQAQTLREILAHKRANGVTAKTWGHDPHVYDLIQEQGFTVLNRLCAVRIAEARGLLVPCISQAMDSDGFQLFDGVADRTASSREERFVAFLFSVFDELSADLGALFDRYSPQGLLFPNGQALGDLLALINEADLKPLWSEDETIGWIYQHWNDPEERKRIKDTKNGGSAAPRNSRELAIRNQFFTPRYVVEFLTDNSLGRLWCEMTEGKTRLTEQCRYLIRREDNLFPRPPKDPREIRVIDPACGSMHFGLYAFDLFEVIYHEAWEMDLAPGLRQEYPSKEEFLKAVPGLIIAHNLHGIDIDPRAVQIAGLSLWLRAHKTWQALGVAPMDRPRVSRSNIVCAETMPGERELLASFVSTSFRPAEQGFFQKLLESVFESMVIAGEAGSLLKIEEDIRSMVQDAREKWKTLGKSPGEFFSDAELAVADRRPGPRQLELNLGSWSLESLSGIPDEEFWEKAEERIYDALRTFAENASGNYQRRLFVDDAARGFAFIDLCRQRYDVALMNPPFGDASRPSKPYIEETYGDTKGDVYKAFVECFQARLVPAGYLGIISSRTGFFLGQSEDWRTRVVLRLFRPIALADLGMGVLDAMVEVAAYVLRSLSAPEARDLTLSIVPVLEKVARDKQDRFSLPKWQAARGGLKRHQAVAELEHLDAHGFIQRSAGDVVRYSPLWHSVKKVTAPPEPVYPSFVCIRALIEDDKGTAMIRAILGPVSEKVAPSDLAGSTTFSSFERGGSSKAFSARFEINPATFKDLPGSPLSYWVPANVIALFGHKERFESAKRIVRTTNPFGDNFRFVRLGVEVLNRVGWRPWIKGSTQRYFSDVDLVVAWDAQRETYRGFVGTSHRPMERPASVDLFNKPGITWPLRARSLSPSYLPQGCIFSARSFMLSAPPEDLKWLIALMSSKIVDYLAKVLLGRWEFPEFIVTVIQQLPFPKSVSDEVVFRLGDAAARAWLRQRSIAICRETSHGFTFPSVLLFDDGSLHERIVRWQHEVLSTESDLLRIQAEIDDECFALYGLDVADRGALTSTLASEATGDVEAEDGEDGEDDEEEAADADAPALAADLLAYALGGAFGRWDIRYATGERPAPPAPDPFAPLPVCPPGMLQDAAGLPAAPGDVPACYPVRITWPGLIVDDPAHPEDIERRVREVLAVLFPGRADAIADEACALFGLKSLRDWFRKPTGFFADHLKRYSKSRRQAPIYWPLSTPSGSYTLWVYYHRLTNQTLFAAVTQFVEPKIADLESTMARLKAKGDAMTATDKDTHAAAAALRTELAVFREDLLAWAHRWQPNLNDGVQITAAPLWKFFRLPKWQNLLKETWTKLEQGNYDWAHLAFSLWADDETRKDAKGKPIPSVREKCKTDKSLAIAHGLDDLHQGD
jgi:hypothetical protein